MRHIDYLQNQLYAEKGRLAMAKSPSEIELRMAWVQQLEREIAAETVLTGDTIEPLDSMSDEDLLKELLGL